MTAAWWMFLVGLLLGPLVMCCGWLVLEWRHERWVRRQIAAGVLDLTRARRALRDDLRAKRGKRHPTKSHALLTAQRAEKASESDV